MKRDWEKQIKDEIVSEVSSVPFSKAEEDRILEAVHRRMAERSKIMKLSKKKISIVLAAAMILVGAATAMGAGRIAYLMSSTSRNDAIFSAEQLLPSAEKKLGQKPKLVAAFADGLKFGEGYVTDVNALDENNNRVDSYPEIYVYYQGDKDVTLSILKPLEGLSQAEGKALLKETYKDVLLQGSIDAYLFLPPTQEPSEADRKLEAEGKLMISYGSETEQRKSFKSVVWEEEGLKYHLFSFDEVELQDLVRYAKEIIDVQ